MNFYCIQCSKFINDTDIKIKREIDGESNFIVTALSVVLKSLKLLMKQK